MLTSNSTARRRVDLKVETHSGASRALEEGGFEKLREFSQAQPVQLCPRGKANNALMVLPRCLETLALSGPQTVGGPGLEGV